MQHYSDTPRPEDFQSIGLPPRAARRGHEEQPPVLKKGRRLSLLLNKGSTRISAADIPVV